MNEIYRILNNKLIKLKNRLIKLKKIPKVKSFEQAKIYCESKTPSAYQSKLLCKYRFDKLKNYIKNKGLNFYTCSNSILLMSIACFLKYNPGKTPNIIDFGGACGENILSLNPIFGDQIFKSSWVLETPAQVEESTRWEFVENIKFASDINQILGNHKIDIFFSSCAINYIEEPYKLLAIVEKYKIPLVCLTRNNFSLNPKPFIQVSNLSDNGFGDHIDNYGNPNIYYPSQTIDEKEIKNIFLKGNYELIIDHSIDKTGVLDKKLNYSKDLLFRRI